MHNGNFFLAIVAIIISVVSAAYYLRVIKVIHFDSPIVTDSSFNTIKSDNQTNYEGNDYIGYLVIATITLFLIFFIFNPTPLLNSAHLLSLTLFNW